MNADYLLIAVAAAALVALSAWVLWNRNSKALLATLKHGEAEGRDLERRFHLREREFLEEKNHIELQHGESLKTARASSFEDGRALGKAEQARDHMNEISTLRAGFSDQLVIERERAATEARDKLRAEYELQTKLFNVKVSPYVEVVSVGGMFKNQELVKTGYQYQLLVNGIPAFQPHVVFEREEQSTKVNEENVKALLQFAKGTAEGAIQMYLGANVQFAKLGPEIFKRIKK